VVVNLVEAYVTRGLQITGHHSQIMHPSTRQPPRATSKVTADDPRGVAATLTESTY